MKWFRVEVSDEHGQMVAIESEMLAGRDIGDSERETIEKAIRHLSGFLGSNDDERCPVCRERDRADLAEKANGELREALRVCDRMLRGDMLNDAIVNGADDPEKHYTLGEFIARSLANSPGETNG